MDEAIGAFKTILSLIQLAIHARLHGKFLNRRGV
jgi:hypothetical protein